MGSGAYSVTQLFGQNLPGLRDSAWEVAVLARPTGQTAPSAARKLQNFGEPDFPGAGTGSGGASGARIC
eukprot:5984351-Alexandrium_andersonii.AAC.1